MFLDGFFVPSMILTLFFFLFLLATPLRHFISSITVPFARQLALLEGNTQNVSAQHSHVSTLVGFETVMAQSLENLSRSSMYASADIESAPGGMMDASLGMGLHGSVNAASRRLMTSYKMYLRKKSNIAFDSVHKLRERVMDVSDATLAQSRAFIQPNKEALAEADLCVDAAQQALEALNTKLRQSLAKYRQEKKKLDRYVCVCVSSASVRMRM